MLNGFAITRQGSRVAFTFIVVSAVVLSGVTLYSLMAGLRWFEGLFLLLGLLVVIWAILFSLFEVRRIADRSRSIGGENSGVDPDGPRTVIVEPPIGHPYPHHEHIEGSAGFDQGQLTARCPDLPPLREWFQRRPKGNQS